MGAQRVRGYDLSSTGASMIRLRSYTVTVNTLSASTKLAVINRA